MNTHAEFPQAWPSCAEAPASARLLQLVPPGRGGVRDFAELLQLRWRESGLPSELLALDPHAAGLASLSDSLQRRAGRVALLLHYSGYGYQRRGLPLALLRQIRQLRHDWGPDLRLVSYFHESFASGPPWRSAFWLQGLQSRVGRQVAQHSDAVCTNTHAHAVWLAPACAGRGPPVRVRPVFAAIGEPGASAEDRPVHAPVAVVFGAAETRARALQACARHASLLQQHGIQSLLEVGPGSSAAGPAGAGLPLRFMGRLDTPALHALLQRCHAGLIDYPASLLAKSSVFAALAAHGVPVLNTRPFDHDADGLRTGYHYLQLAMPGREPPRWLREPATRSALAQAAHAWYQPHASWQQAAELARLLLGLPAAASSGPALTQELSQLTHSRHIE